MRKNALISLYGLPKHILFVYAVTNLVEFHCSNGKNDYDVIPRYNGNIEHLMQRFKLQPKSSL